MLISLVGIIWIQTSWIGDAIAEQEQDFEVRVNEALNTVNDSIDSDEVALFLERRFGGVDSLVNDFLILEQLDSNATLEINVSHENSDLIENDDEITVIHSDPKPNKDLKFKRKPSDSNKVEMSSAKKKADSNQIVWSSEVIETRIQSNDSTFAENEVVFKRKNRVKTFVKHYTYETMLSGDLKDRIQPKDLEEKIGNALKKEGIPGKFAFAVKNGETGIYESGFTSNNYDSTATQTAFSKKLFQSDRGDRMNYTLYVQPEDSSNFVWAKVWKMTALSIVFTVLILLSFGYALYFIFKQKKVSQVKNDFINNMTHELKTPLASISIAAASIKHPEIINKPEEVRRLTKLIEDEKARINSHVERVLDTAALDSGELKLSVKEVALIDILKRSAKNVELGLLQAHGTISIPESENYHVMGDAFHLTNVFTNIFDNSIKYRSEKAPVVSVKILENNNSLTVSIEDNGIGMTAKQQKLAFDKFYRAESGDIHNRKGFGLGLSYVRSVVQKLQGTVGMKSKLGEGTTINIELPKV
ncbi:MAG: sensor histidine kinase [Fluviicola sp.]